MAIILGLIILFIICKCLGFALKTIVRLYVNSILGLVILYLVNTFTGPLGIYIPLNWLNGLIVSLFGIPGFIFLAILQ